jgi:hypothetical protein
MYLVLLLCLALTYSYPFAVRGLPSTKGELLQWSRLMDFREIQVDVAAKMEKRRQTWGMCRRNSGQFHVELQSGWLPGDQDTGSWGSDGLNETGDTAEERFIWGCGD